jgi:hypothetical protein
MASSATIQPGADRHHITELLKFKLKALCEKHLLMRCPPRTALRDWMLAQFITPDQRWSQGIISTEPSTGDIIRERLEYVLPCKLRPDLSYIRDAPHELSQYWQLFTVAAEKLWLFCGGSAADDFVRQVRHPCPRGLDALKHAVETLRSELAVHCRPSIDQLIQEFLSYAAVITASAQLSTSTSTLTPRHALPGAVRNKLIRLYQKHPGNDPEACDRIVSEAWYRFDSLDIGNHALAVPERVWEVLKHELKVVLEGFSNAANCHEGPFCSPFPELEAPFGAVGNFFAQKFEGGGVVAANPPYINEIMSAMAEHVLTNLEGAEEQGTPLAFFSCFPYWHDSPAFLRLKQSPFCLTVADMHRVPFHSVLGHQIFVNTYCLWLANPSYMQQHPDGVERFQTVIQAWYAEKNRCGPPSFKPRGLVTTWNRVRKRRREQEETMQSGREMKRHAFSRGGHWRRR